MSTIQWSQHRYLLFFPMLCFCAIGLIFVASASMGSSDALISVYGLKQFIFFITGLFIYVLGFQLAQKDLFFKKKVLWFAAFILLLLPLSPLGKTINGASRWITPIPGLSLQLSEFVKVLWVVILAIFSYDHHFLVQKRWRETIGFCLALSMILLLILAQPDFGSTFVLASVTMLTLFVAKVRMDLMFVLSGVLLGVVSYLVTHASYRMKRLLAFLDPQAYAQGEAYQLWQSLISLSSGDIFGQGLGQSWQKYQALPECHTDFIFSIMVEEVGFIGGFLFITFYFAWIMLLFYLAKGLAEQKKYLAAYIHVAAGCLFLVQLFVNLGVCIGLLPTKGLTLPFISYGGSSLWAFMLLVGLLDGVRRRE